MEAVVNVLEIARRVAQKLGPYVLLEILLPGGTLVALALFIYRHRKLQGRPAPWNATAPGRVLARIAERAMLFLQRCSGVPKPSILADASS